jgi:nitrate reductase NapE component
LDSYRELRKLTRSVKPLSKV